MAPSRIPSPAIQGGLEPADSGDPASCAAARAATLRLLVRHISDDPHVDDATAPLGEFAIGRFKLIFDNGVAVVNAGQPLPGTTAPTS